MKVYGAMMSSPCVRWGCQEPWCRGMLAGSKSWLFCTQLCDVDLSSVSWGGRPSWSCTEESCEALRTVPGTQIPHDVIHGEHTTHLQKAHILKGVVLPRQIRNQPITHNRVPTVSQALFHILGTQQWAPAARSCPPGAYIPACLDSGEKPWTVLQAGAPGPTGRLGKAIGARATGNPFCTHHC